MFSSLSPMLGSFDARLAATMYINALTAVDKVATDKVVLYRNYYDGIQADAFTEAQIKLLGADIDATLNICETTVSTICNRQKVRSVTIKLPENTTGNETPPETPIDQPISGSPTTPSLSSQMTTLLQQVWDQNRMDEQTSEIHLQASRDAEVFVITDFDPATNQTRYTVNEAFDGVRGMFAVYSDDKKQVKYFVKRWKETILPHTNNKRTIERMTVYYADRVERWIKDIKLDSTWQPYRQQGEMVYIEGQGGATYEASVVWLTDSTEQGGIPLGFPVFHFAANVIGGKGKSDLADLVPGVQDGVNMANAMIIAAEQLAGTPINYVAGENLANMPINRETGEPQELEYYPGGLLTLPGATTVGQLAAANIEQLNNSLDAKLRRAANIAQIPPGSFVTTGQVSAEGTLQQTEVGLIAKVERRQVNFGNRYEDMSRYTFKLLVAFDDTFTMLGSGQAAFDTIDDMEINCEWEPAAIRNEVVEAQTGKAYLDLGVAPEIVQRKFTTLSPAEIAESKALNEQSKNATMGQMALALMSGGNTNGGTNGAQPQPTPAA